MKRWKVLVTAPRALSVIEMYHKKLGAAGCEVVVKCPLERLEEDELLDIVGDIDGIICGDDRITKNVLDEAPRLKVISKWGVGIDSIDVAEAERRGIAVYNIPGAFNDPVADTVLGYVLLFTRKLDHMAAEMRAGLWRRLSLVSLKDCTMGIIGLGNIGRAVARRAAVFGMKIISYTIDQPDEEILGDLQIEMVSLDELLSVSDFITLHLDLRESNRHIINEKKLNLMKPDAVLINTARGALIDEEALINALRLGRIRGAALDVFEKEPLAPDSALRKLDNVYLAPHNAGGSESAAENVHENSIENLLKGLSLGVRNEQKTP